MDNMDVVKSIKRTNVGSIVDKMKDNYAFVHCREYGSDRIVSVDGIIVDIKPYESMEIRTDLCATTPVQFVESGKAILNIMDHNGKIIYENNAVNLYTQKLDKVGQDVLRQMGKFYI